MNLIVIKMEMEKLEKERQQLTDQLGMLNMRLKETQRKLGIALIADAVEKQNWDAVLHYYRTYEFYMDIDTFTKLADAGYTIAEAPLKYDGIKIDGDGGEDGARCVIPQLAKFTFTAIQRTDDEIIFTRSDGRRVKMWHSQDCCEGVYIESIVGDLDALIGKPMVIAETVSNYSDDQPYGDERWTFYRLGTDIGNIVTIRWHGESNGYYSTYVTVDVIE